jgi:hypothetical protein
VTADWIEVAWTLIALVGVLLALGELAYALGDRDLVLGEAEASPVDEHERKLEVALVEGDVAGARWIIGIEATNLLVGVLAMLTEPAAGGRSPLGWAVVLLLIAAAAGMPLWLLGRRRRRAQLLGARVRPRP